MREIKRVTKRSKQTASEVKVKENISYNCVKCYQIQTFDVYILDTEINKTYLFDVYTLDIETNRSYFELFRQSNYHA